MPANLPPGVQIRRGRGDFSTFWVGQTISTLGTSFTTFALPLLVYTLTGSSLDLALTVVVAVLPYMLFGLVIGAWVDRINRKRIMMITDVARALVIASLPVFAAFSLLSIWWVYLVAFVSSTLSICFDAANFAAVPSLMSRDDLVWANGRIQGGYAVARVIGPLLAGLLLVVIQLPLLFLIDAGSFLASAMSLALIQTSFNAEGRQAKATTIRQDILEGLRYILGHPTLRSITLLLLVVNFLLPTALAQLVLLAKQGYSATDAQVGWLYAAGGLGTAIVSLSAGRLPERGKLGLLCLGALALEGLMTAAGGLLSSYWTLLPVWTLRGGGDVLFIICTYSITQAIVPNELLGRVITFMRVVSWSLSALGALIGGFLIEKTKQVSPVYVGIGLLIFGCAAAFTATPLRYIK